MAGVSLLGELTSKGSLTTTPGVVLAESPVAVSV
jgi:hypothetical protein